MVMFVMNLGCTFLVSRRKVLEGGGSGVYGWIGRGDTCEMFLTRYSGNLILSSLIFEEARVFVPVCFRCAFCLPPQWETADEK